MLRVTTRSTRVGAVVLAALLMATGAWIALRLGAGATSAAPANGSFALMAGLQHPFADSGSAPDVSEARAAVQAALTSEDTAAAVGTDHTPRLSHAQRVALLSQNETSTHAAQLAAAIEAALGEQPFVRSGHFVVEQWQGVVVGDHSAKAFVTGHDAVRQVDGTPWRDASYQARVLLTRFPSAQHGWLVSEIISTPLD